MVLAVMSSSGFGNEIHRISLAQNEQAVTGRLLTTYQFIKTPSSLVRKRYSLLELPLYESDPNTLKLWFEING